MNSQQKIVDWAKKRNWSLIQHIDLGTTADVFILDSGRCKYALKASHEQHPYLKTEYLLLQYLRQTPMGQFVPKVYEWIPEIGGFLMEYLLYPDAVSKPEAVQSMARMLKALHGIDLPAALDVRDDRPEIIQAITKRFSNLIHQIWENGASWNTLPREDLNKLEIVRKHYEAHSKLLTTLEATAIDAKAALVHGDLAGDNIMMAENGEWVLTDWGETRISWFLADIASLFTYSGWSAEDIRQFNRLYFEKDEAELEKELFLLGVLSKLYCYRSCVQSLLWLREEGPNGLDAVGRKHFERLLNAL